MKWYDVPCYIRGFAKGDHQFSFNPLCEHEPWMNFTEPLKYYEQEGLKQVGHQQLFTSLNMYIQGLGRAKQSALQVYKGSSWCYKG